MLDSSHEEVYNRHPHIVRGSIVSVPRGQEVVCGKGEKIESHGLICVIKCVNADFAPKCLKTRVINVQDARQVIKCTTCTKNDRNMRRRVSYNR